MRPDDLIRYKRHGRPILALTAWDALSARWVQDSGADVLLVGDSLAMTALGHATTLPVTLEDMLHHCRAVGRGLLPPPHLQPLLICDLPFLSYQCGPDDAVAAAGRALKEAPAAAVKVEGAEPEILEVIDRLVRMGIPVMGHVGLTPQSVHQLGYRRQGGDPVSQERLEQQALALQAAGCFALVLEHIPSTLAGRLRHRLSIPVIGIGAGDDCDGQVRVSADLLGLSEAAPPFSPPLLEGGRLFGETLRDWVLQQQQHPATHPTSRAAPATGHC
ncbi:3-methyl-2-oxobutanoate hydroxymethyltransferase [Synechococcus sp. RSCCF101]|uniref:3-methyl-2-oxobutanoate hydroxymethyltransferase n=1 Tax=Synechococcus sp. RSCCF101 TaxID=2511069 RepID=UPI001248161D|nr:3-methyl-2-oxobutanoate hydroxymethyltransferase [Synechococcus sp. RSCCF101]QEY30886.1 3-methyl-2-oxobutanoate hydroxymethyltransferase [Synechococcus sp. RSCCF101]QEY33240.1 3-methyl-2-oxobutanoate hydroxymethyltransferase [Synechococcus sp. RSCCF101]